MQCVRLMPPLLPHTHRLEEDCLVRSGLVELLDHLCSLVDTNKPLDVGGAADESIHRVTSLSWASFQVLAEQCVSWENQDTTLSSGLAQQVRPTLSVVFLSDTFISLNHNVMCVKVRILYIVVEQTMMPRFISCIVHTGISSPHKPPLPCYGSTGGVRGWGLGELTGRPLPPIGTSQESDGQGHPLTASLCLKAPAPAHRSEASHITTVCLCVQCTTCTCTYTFQNIIIIT